MDFWTTLGIEKTKEIDAINAAYRAKLPLCNPEDNPEEFMALRAEYDEALKYAQEQQPAEKDESELTPLELWMRRLDGIYQEISRRCDAQQWRDLLNDPICNGIDSRLDARDAMLKYIMNNDNLPKEIWQILEDKFRFEENAEALYDVFPRNFIDNCVLSGSKNDPYVPYDLFLPHSKGNIDPYFSLFFSAQRKIYDGDFDSAAAIIEDIGRSGIVHPYTDLLRLRMEFHKSGRKPDDALLERTSELYQRYPDDSEFIELCGDIYEAAGEDQRAKELFLHGMELDPKNRAIEYRVAMIHIKLNEYKEAKALLCDLNSEAPYNSDIREILYKTNEKLKELYAAQLENDPDNIELRMDYAWCCLQTDEYDKIKELIDFPAPEDIAARCDYENFCTKYYNSIEDFNAQLEHAIAWREAVALLPEGETEKEKKRKNKTGESYYLEAIALYCLDRTDEALEKADLALNADPNETGIFYLRHSIYKSLHDWDSALKACEDLVKIKPDHNSYVLLATNQYDMGLMQDSYNNFGKAIEYYKELSCYLYRVRILCRYDQYDEAQEIIDLIESQDIDTDGVKFCKALITAGRDKNPDEAMRIYREIIDNYEKDPENSSAWLIWEVYSFACDYMYDHDATADEMLDLVDRGLETNGDYYSLLDHKAFVLDQMKDEHEKALEVYLRILELYPKNRFVNQSIGNIYTDDLYDMDKALEHYNKQIKINETARAHLSASLCLCYKQDYAQAMLHLQRAEELDSDSYSLYNRYAILYERQGQNDKAMECIEKYINIVNDHSDVSMEVPLRHKAKLLARMKRYDEAAQTYLEAFALSDDNDDISSAVEMYQHSGMFNKAEELIEKYKEKLGDEYYTLCKTRYELRGDFKKMLSSINSLPDSNDSKLRCLASYYWTTGDYKKSLEYGRRHFASHPDNAGGRSTAIYTMKYTGQTEDIEEFFEEGMRTIELDSKKPWCVPFYWTKKAFLLLSVGKFEEALECIEKAKAAPLCNACEYPFCLDVMDAMADYYEEIGDFDRAVELSKENLALFPDNVDCSDRIRRILRHHKRKLKKENRK